MRLTMALIAATAVLGAGAALAAAAPATVRFTSVQLSQKQSKTG